MFQKKYIVIKIKGGLGNQLFCYAFGYSLARKYSAHLLIDKYSGFVNDRKYKRVYLLNNFNLNSKELNIILLFVLHIILKLKFLFNFSNKIHYVYEKSMNYNKDNLILPEGFLFYVDGYWQSEKYFLHNKLEIVNQFNFSKLPFISPNNLFNLITSNTSISLHFRTFDFENLNSDNNLNLIYYQTAIKFFSDNYNSVRYFIFTNNYGSQLYDLIKNLNLTNYTIVWPSNKDDTLRDFYLMQNCKHHIIANSTFSWWAAWISNNKNKIVIASKTKNKDISAWGFEGLLPDSWKLI